MSLCYVGLYGSMSLLTTCNMHHNMHQTRNPRYVPDVVQSAPENVTVEFRPLGHSVQQPQ